MGDDFDYNSLWEKEEEKKDLEIKKEVIDNLPRGLPRRGVNITKRFRVKR